MKIQRTNGEFINRIVGNTEGDYFVKFEGTKEVYHFHIEFQSDGDYNMALRMFLYGFKYADSNRNKANIYDTIELDFPMQKVIYLDKDDRIQDEIKVKFNFSDKESYVYSVKVLKLADYETVDLVEKGMYNLIPFKVIKVRKNLANIIRRKISEEERTILINEQYTNLENIMKEITEVVNELKDKNEISILDYETFMLEATNLMEYFYGLYDKYINYKYITEEVRKVVKSVVDPKLKEAYLAAEEKLEKAEAEKEKEKVEKEKEKLEKEKAINVSRNLLITLLEYKFKDIDGDIKEKINAFNAEEVDSITLKIKDINTIDDLYKILN